MILLLLFISAAGCNKQGSAETAAVDPGVNESYIDPEPEPESITEESKISEKIIPLSFISQNPDFPSGCEGCSAVMLMSYYGIIITPESFFSKYLPISDIPFDPDITYGGNPRDNTGLGCNAPPLAAGMNRILGGDKRHARILTGKTMQELCSEYIDNDNPVIIWGSVDMAKVHTTAIWSYGHKTIVWRSPEHCLVLVGYDDDNYIFNDPMRGENKRYPKAAAEAAYNEMRQQAIIIEKNK